MITKSGNKSKRTVYMENSIERFFLKQYGVKLFSEVTVEGHKRADLVGWALDENTGEEDFIVIEIKQNREDFYTGYGLNFVGISNYLAVPTELVGYAIVFLREMEEKPFVGVLEVDACGLVRDVIHPKINVESPHLKARDKHIYACLTCLHLQRKINNR